MFHFSAHISYFMISFVIRKIHDDIDPLSATNLFDAYIIWMANECG